MSENENVETDVTTEVDTKDTGKGLRAQLERQVADNAKLRTQLLDRSYKELGLDPTKLVGKAIAEKYDGDPTTEALATFAKDEYGYEPPAPEEQHPQAQQIALAQASLDQVGQTAGSVVPPTQQDQLAKAEAEGDWQTAMNLKAQQMEAMLKRR